MLFKKGSFLHNLSFVFGAQTLVLIISVLRALILPKFLPIEGFGYWEMYLFYTSYVGIFCLGYNDGIYLQFGECDVDKLPIDKIRSANRLFSAFLSLISILSIIFLVSNTKDPQISFALCFSAANILIMGMISVYIYVFQITGQFKKYSFFSVIDKIAVLITILFLILVNKNNYRIVVVADFLSKLSVLFLMIVKMPSLVFGEFIGFKSSFTFLTENMFIGIKLMVANLMSMLLVGAGKFIVQFYGDITEFAEYSFGISVTGLVLTAVTAISLVLYPTIKRIPFGSYGQVFGKVNTSTRVLGLLSLLLYYPMYLFIEHFYPNYISVLSYLSVLFLIVYLQCKISLLNNTFYKVLRLETKMFAANMSCVAVFIVLAMVFFPRYREMDTIAICTMIAMLIRCYASEITLSKKVYLIPNARMLVEVGLALVFFITTRCLPIVVSALVFILAIAVWLFVDRKENKVIWELVAKQ
jgi:O-antigen/teichoic acid export membrane protein